MAPSSNIAAGTTSWAQREVFRGALFGFVFSAILVVIPLRTDILAIGVIGTMITAVFESAIITGGFAALAAALSTYRRLDANAVGAEAPARNTPLAAAKSNFACLPITTGERS
jgi:hypothetical protein